MDSGGSREDQIIAAYADGEDVASIAARFGSHPREIEHIVAATVAAPAPASGPAARVRFNAPPGWPVPPAGWIPPAGWRPDGSWPQPPPGWEFFLDDAATVVAPPADDPARDPDLLDQLRRLGELWQAGIVTDEEFATKKAEILARL
jgi:hypothetical protein